MSAAHTRRALNYEIFADRRDHCFADTLHNQAR